jgi:hypothetical protein
MKTRTLKIESTGDFFKGRVSPKIRLVGQWLERAGFKPGHRVAVQISEPGILTLRFLGQSNACEQQENLPFQNSATLPILGDLL